MPRLEWCRKEDLLDFITLWGELVFPVHKDSGVCQYQRHVHRCILDTNALVGTAAEDEIAPGVGIGTALRVQPPFRNELIGAWEDCGIMQRVIERRDDHATGWDSIVIADGERFDSLVRNLKEDDEQLPQVEELKGLP